MTTINLTFMGDSVTRGVDPSLPTSSTGGFRKVVRDQLLDAYPLVYYTGTVTDSLGDWDRHEGWNGFEIASLAAKVPNLDTAESDLIVLMAGVNDLTQPVTTVPILTAMASRMGSLLDTIHAERPDALVVVLTLPPVAAVHYTAPSSDAYRLAYNAALPAQIATRSAWASLIDVADVYTTFSGTYDGLHPNAFGHARLGEAIAEGLTGTSGALRTLFPPDAGTVPTDPVLTDAAGISLPPIEADDASGTLRVWCLGDELTEGAISGSFHSAGGGYRATLRTALAAMGYTITFVGTLLGSDTPATAHDGHLGSTIADLREHVADWQAEVAPDLVLLLAGTRDLISTTPLLSDRKYAGTRLLSLVDDLLEGTGTPVVAVSALPPVNVGVGGYRTDVPGLVTAVNEQVRHAIRARSSRGQSVVWIDAELTTGDLSDGHCLTSGGYAKLAYAWLQGVPFLVGRAAA
jgi:lysophospholipase L1-like esterase